MVAPEGVRFGRGGAFSADLRARVEAYFEHRPRRDLGRMYLKSAIILAWFVGSWALLVWVASTWWQAGLLAISLGLAMAGIGMSIQHDANHGAYSARPWVNRLFGSTLDMIGLSSFIWRHKHNVIHHTYTNIRGVDYDIDFGWLARLSPDEPHRWYFRYQQIYLWPLYGFLLPKLIVEDFAIVATRRLGPHRLPKMSGRQLFVFGLGKLSFASWAIVVPALYQPLPWVLVFFFVASHIQGIIVASTFQVAHCVEEAELPAAKIGETMHEDWAAHQVETTTSFVTRSRLLRWFVAGLDHQIEHHLFPRVCHLHYPALAAIVDEVATAHGLEVRRLPSVKSALVSHARHLRRLGQPG